LGLRRVVTFLLVFAMAGKTMLVAGRTKLPFQPHPNVLPSNHEIHRN
jgi:hypothetical protein